MRGESRRKERLEGLIASVQSPRISAERGHDAAGFVHQKAAAPGRSSAHHHLADRMAMPADFRMRALDRLMTQRQRPELNLFHHLAADACQARAVVIARDPDPVAPACV